MESLSLVALLVALGYIVFYLRTLYVNEGYKDCKDCKTVLDTSTSTQVPYVTTETSQGDFEQDFIYQTEGGRDVDREAIDLARRKFPFDWSQLPPDSSLFQAQQAMFTKEPSAKAAPFKLDTYDKLDAVKVLPPDVDSENSKEADMLKTYAPMKNSKHIKAIDDKSVNKLIQNMYGEKGLVAKVAKKANNVYEIYEVQEKKPKIVWEEELQASVQSNELNPKMDASDMLVVPDAVNDVQSGLTAYASGENSRMGRRTVSDYNPNLDGIFGPKMQWQQYG